MFSCGTPICGLARLTRAFADDPARQRQWLSFAQGLGTDLPPFGEVVVRSLLS
jgi:hypothetical protein